MPNKRCEYLSWDEYFMGQAIEASLRSKDPSTQVGACIVNSENKQISIGYNGLTNGMDDDNFYWDSPGEETNDIYTTKNFWVAHAEANAILNSHGADLTGTTIYVTLFPCNECCKLIIQSGIKKVIYLRNYNKGEVVRVTKEMFDKAGVSYVPFNKEIEFTKKEVQDSSFEIQKILKRFSKKKDIPSNITNLEIDDYFMEKAYEESKFSTCRRQVGAVFVKNDSIISKGYNDAATGVKRCSDLDGCMRVRDNIKSGTMQEHCRAVHAEQRAMISALNNGDKLIGSTLYVTTYPCSICTRMLIECGVEKIVYDGEYFDLVSHQMLEEANVKVKKLNN